MSELSDRLHILRNPWGYSEDEVRQTRLWVADALDRAEAVCEEVELIIAGAGKWRALAETDGASDHLEALLKAWREGGGK